MDISINNIKVEESFSPGTIAGAKTMLRRRYLTRVNDDDKSITIRFTPADDAATTSLAAIKIRKTK